VIHASKISGWLLIIGGSIIASFGQFYRASRYRAPLVARPITIN